MGTPLLDRINDEPHDPMCGIEGVLCPTCENAPWEPVLINRHSGLPEPEWVQRAEAKRPAWLRRMDEQGLPPQDRTSTIKGAA